MKYRLITCFLLFSGCVFVAGCGPSGPTNIMDSTNEAALAEYEAALADADRMAEQDTDVED